MNRYLYASLYLAINIVAFYFIGVSYVEDRQKLSDYQTSQLSHIYEGALTTYRLNAKGVFDNIVMQPDVLEMLRQLPDAEGETLEALHYKLYGLLKSRYLNMKESLYIRQLHFHKPDGRSFLRMHRPDKFGDPLFDVRYSLELANTKKIYVEGFEEGRIFNGYRYVYPIIDNGRHLGSVEISVSMNAIIKQLDHIFKHHTFYFMIDKEVVGEKVFKSEKSNYLPAKLHPGFLVDQEVRSLFDPSYERYLSLLSSREGLIKGLYERQSRVRPESINGRHIIATFLPIYNVKKESVAYLVAFETNPAFHSRWVELVYQVVSVIMTTTGLFLLLFYLMRRADYAERQKHKLDLLVTQKTDELEQMQAKQLQTYRDIVLALVNLTEERDTYTAGHTRRVAEYAQMLARAMGYSGEDLETLYEAAILHDIGKIVTPDSVLLKPAKLNAREYDIIKEHVIVSESILQNINFHAEVIEIVKYHHERYDGSGYPYGITNDEIPMLSRILAVADTFDAMTTNRIYKPRKTITAALEELEPLAGVLYDPDVVAVAAEIFRDIHIDLSVTQLPTNVIEQERLSHYFKDPLTDLYNLRYLHLLLEFGMDGNFYECANIISIKGFTAFNREQGWEAGNRVLQKMAENLQRTFDKAMLFRIYGDDFVVLSMEHIEIDIETLHEHFSKTCHFDLDLNLLHYEMLHPEERIALKAKLEKAVG
jgi:putative nucleotidyltransferase with HDIG domain